MAESPHCLPESITTLLISYTPVQYRKFFLKSCPKLHNKSSMLQNTVPVLTSIVSVIRNQDHLIWILCFCWAAKIFPGILTLNESHWIAESEDNCHEFPCIWSFFKWASRRSKLFFFLIMRVVSKKCQRFNRLLCSKHWDRNIVSPVILSLIIFLNWKERKYNSKN